MIAQLHGQIVGVDGTGAVISVGGVGFAVLCPPQLLASAVVGDEVTWFTSLIVRDDALTLYAFGSLADRACFDLVQSASGIGPKIALAVVSVLGASGLADAVRRENLTALIKVPGIGRKGAQKMVIELKDKVPSLLSVVGQPAGAAQAAIPATWRDQVLGGLEGLGWSIKDAEAAVDAVAPMVEDDPDVPVATLMRAALRTLARA
ncbi:MAG: Holliday junction branch migration protein RuvA [Propionibacteriaceae bacterium]|nr:Holliday junction branch migration protein RuvA [Propionibacteriaceae bacterium]